MPTSAKRVCPLRDCFLRRIFAQHKDTPSPTFHHGYKLTQRLTSYAKQHTLYQALKAFGQIIKTQLILEYIDNVELRQAVEKQLNKVEHSHNFSNAVFYGNNQEFTQATKEEQEKADACKRLIQNAIILWTYLYLSKTIMDETDQEKRKQLLKTIQSGSVVTRGAYTLTRGV